MAIQPGPSPSPRPTRRPTHLQEHTQRAGYLSCSSFLFVAYFVSVFLCYCLCIFCCVCCGGRWQLETSWQLILILILLLIIIIIVPLARPEVTSILQIQRRLLPLVKVMDVELLLRLLLRRPQIPHQVGQAPRPGQAACLLLGQLVRVPGCPSAAARRVQGALTRIVMIVAARTPAVGQGQWQGQGMRRRQVAVDIEDAAALEHHIGWCARRGRGAVSSCSCSRSYCSCCCG